MNDKNDNETAAKSGVASSDLLAKLVDVLNAYEGSGPLMSCQGQGMDGYSALANFVAIAKEARKTK